MSDIPFTDIIQDAYDRAKKDLALGKLPVSKIEDLCHVAYFYAFLDLYRGARQPDYDLHYSKPIDRLYEMFDNGKLKVSDMYATFAFCYIKVYEIEGLVSEKTFKAQFEHEKNIKV